MKDRLPLINDNLKNCRFFIDDPSVSADIWIIWGGVSTKTSIKIKCHPENFLFLTDEAHDSKRYHPAFIKQFAKVFTLREDILHPELIRTHELNTWHLGKSYDDVFNQHLIPKQKMLSVVCSDLTDLPGHKLRFGFVNRLIGHFKDRIDVFGRGFNPIPDKWPALAPYKYSVAIENCVKPGYFTEKLTECFLSHTMPIYYGAPDILNFFNEKSLCLIDPENYKSSIDKIEQLIEEDPYDQILPVIIEQKLLYLTKYHIFQALDKLLPIYFKPGEKKTICLRPEYLFQRGSLARRVLNRIAKHL